MAGLQYKYFGVVRGRWLLPASVFYLGQTAKKLCVTVLVFPFVISLFTRNSANVSQLAKHSSILGLSVSIRDLGVETTLSL
jgi:hypothetical protein